MGVTATKLKIHYRASKTQDPRFTTAENAYTVVKKSTTFQHRQKATQGNLNKYTCSLTLDDGNDRYKIKLVATGPGDAPGSALNTHTVIYEGSIEDVVDYFDADRNFSTTRYNLRTQSVTYTDTLDDGQGSVDGLYTAKVLLTDGVRHAEQYSLDEDNVANVNKSEMDWELALSEKTGAVSVVDFKMVEWGSDSIYFTLDPEKMIPWDLFTKDKGGWFSGGGA